MGIVGKDSGEEDSVGEVGRSGRGGFGKGEVVELSAADQKGAMQVWGGRLEGGDGGRKRRSESRLRSGAAADIAV